MRNLCGKREKSSYHASVWSRKTASRTLVEVLATPRVTTHNSSSFAIVEMHKRHHLLLLRPFRKIKLRIVPTNLYPTDETQVT